MRSLMHQGGRVGDARAPFFGSVPVFRGVVLRTRGPAHAFRASARLSACGAWARFLRRDAFSSRRGAVSCIRGPFLRRDARF